MDPMYIIYSFGFLAFITLLGNLSRGRLLRYLHKNKPSMYKKHFGIVQPNELSRIFQPMDSFGPSGKFSISKHIMSGWEFAVDEKSKVMLIHARIVSYLGMIALGLFVLSVILYTALIYGKI